MFISIRSACPLAPWLLLLGSVMALGSSDLGSSALGDERYQPKKIVGWTVQVDRRLLSSEPEKTAIALKLLTKQFERDREGRATASRRAAAGGNPMVLPEYPQVTPRAEYHPAEAWLRENGRDPAMAKGIEFTNIRIFEAETRRMPNFALHELAHAYHDRVLPQASTIRNYKRCSSEPKRALNTNRSNASTALAEPPKSELML